MSLEEILEVGRFLAVILGAALGLGGLLVLLFH